MRSHSLVSRVAFLLIFIVFIATSLLAADGPSWVGAFYVKGKVGLKWKAFQGATQYRIYRQSAEEDFSGIGTTDKTQYFDANIIAGTVYSYKIAAITSDGSEAFSTEKSVTIPGGGAVEDFKAPTWSGIRVDRNKIFLNWDRVPGTMAYNIYRSTVAGGDYEVVGNVSINRYADKDGLEKGTTYYYVITALNEEFEETEYSEEHSIKFGQSLEEQQAAEAAEFHVELEVIPFTFLFEINKGGKLDMEQPAEVAVNSKGDIYITDALNQRINIYDSKGNYKSSFGEKGDADADGEVLEGTFALPFSLFIDNQDQVYVGDPKNNNIQVFSSEGDFLRFIKVPAAEGVKAFRPNGIHAMDDGRVICTDAGNHRVIIFDKDGNVIKTFGSQGAEDGQFNFPDGITVTSDGTICVVDAIGGRVELFDQEGNFIRKFGERGQHVGAFGRPKKIFAAPDDRLWVSDGMGHSIQVFTIEGEVKSAFTEFPGTEHVVASPRGVFVKDGRFYLVNRLPNTVLVFKIG